MAETYGAPLVHAAQHASNGVDPVLLGIPRASDQGFICWSIDPASCGSGTAPTSGTLQLARLRVPYDTVITNIWLWVTTQGSSLTSGDNFAGVWDSSGNLLGITADQTTAWGSTGMKQTALTSATKIVRAGAYVYGGFWSVGSTPAAFARAVDVSSVGPNANLSAPNLRYATANTSLTTTAPDPFGTQTAAGRSWFVGLS